MTRGRYEAIAQIELLIEQAMSAHRSGQYAMAESLLAEAERLAGEHAGLAIRIRVRFWLADARRMQGRLREALPTYVWLIGIVEDAHGAAELAGDSRSLRYIARAFDSFVEIGRFLPEMPVSQLHEVIDQGLAFLAGAGRPEWAHALRLQRGTLYKKEGKPEQARRELEAALALRRRDADGIGCTLGQHLNDLGDVLLELEDYEAAARVYTEVWEGGEHDAYDRQGVARGLAWTEKSRGQLAAAERWARESVAIAQCMESAGAKEYALEVLLAILLDQGNVADAARVGIDYARQCRLEDSVESHYFRGRRLAELWLASARAAIGLDPGADESLPGELPAIGAGQRLHAGRRLAAAAFWLALAREPVQRLDGQTGGNSWQNIIAKLAEIYAQLRRLLDQAPAAHDQ